LDQPRLEAPHGPLKLLEVPGPIRSIWQLRLNIVIISFFQSSDWKHCTLRLLCLCILPSFSQTYRWMLSSASKISIESRVELQNMWYKKVESDYKIPSLCIHQSSIFYVELILFLLGMSN
jgi:hypothetical protein